MALVVDIETIGQSPEEIAERAREILYRALEKDTPSPEELERRRQELEERFGLDPTTGYIVCIGVLETDTREEAAFFDTNESNILRHFWQYLARRPPERFVTFNGKSFDFPYIIIRSAILGLAPSRVLPLERYRTGAHFDVREMLAGYDPRRRGTLDYFCAIFGIPSPKEHLDGSRIAEAFRRGRLREIADYCIEDCRATAALYERLRPFYDGTEAL